MINFFRDVNEDFTYQNSSENISGNTQSTDILDILSRDPPLDSPFADMFNYQENTNCYCESYIKKYPNPNFEENQQSNPLQDKEDQREQPAEYLLAQENTQREIQNRKLNNQDYQVSNVDIDYFLSNSQPQNGEMDSNLEYEYSNIHDYDCNNQYYEDKLFSTQEFGSGLFSIEQEENREQLQSKQSMSLSLDNQQLTTQSCISRDNYQSQASISSEGSHSRNEQIIDVQEEEEEEESKIMEIEFYQESQNDYNNNENLFSSNIDNDSQICQMQSDSTDSQEGNLRDRDQNFTTQQQKGASNKKKNQQKPQQKRTYSLIAQELYSEYQLQSYEMIIQLLKQGVNLKKNFEHYGLQGKQTLVLSTLQGQITKLIKGTNKYSPRSQIQDAISLLKEQAVGCQEIDFSQGKKILNGLQTNISRKTCQRQMLKAGLKFITTNNNDQYNNYPENKRYILKVLKNKQNQNMPYLKLVQKN